MQYENGTFHVFLMKVQAGRPVAFNNAACFVRVTLTVQLNDRVRCVKRSYKSAGLLSAR